MQREFALAVCLLACPAANIVAASTPSPTFSARRDYPDVGGRQIAVWDANGDGIPDIIELAGSAETIEVLFGNGNGTFHPGPNSQIEMGDAFTFAAADVNGDGKMDLILAGEAYLAPGAGIGVSFGRGDGTFQPAVFYPAGSDATTYAVTVGDFNNDGITDAATVGTSGIWLFTGKGGGLFNPGVLIPFNGATGFNNLASADFRRDGKLDLVVSTATGFAVMLGNGNGTFQPQQNFSNPQNPGTSCVFALGALSTGGYPAIAANCGTLGQVPLYLSNGTGIFSAPIYVDMPFESVGAIADVNGDGIPDLVSHYGYVALGEGHGRFKAPVYYPIEMSIDGEGGNVVAAHLRSAKFMDIVVQGSSAVSVLLNTGNRGFADGLWTALPAPAGCGTIGDYNGDGKPDFATDTSLGVSILLGTGSATAPFTIGTPITLANASCPITADINGDGIPDLLVPSYTNPQTSSAGAINAYLGKGNGTFTSKGATQLTTLGFVVAADFNRDGKLDFATSSNFLALGNGDGTFQTPTQLLPTPPIGGFLNIAAGDLNGDGWPDLVLTNYNLEVIYVLLNNQHGGFTATSFPVCQHGFTACSPSEVIVADVNGDGFLDLVVGIIGDGGVAVYLGNGQGAFTESATLSDVLLTPGPIMVADVNGDGIPDIGLMEAATLGIYLGNGDGTFGHPFYIGAGPEPGDLLPMNLHGQLPAAGVPDLVAPDGSGGVMVLINNTKPQ